MKKGRGRKSSSNKAILISLIIFVCLFIIGVPLAIVTFSLNTLPTSSVNIAVIPIEGIITGNGDSGLGQQGVSSQQIIEFIQQANGDYTIDGIILEINSPGGSAVASDEIGSAVKHSEIPVISVIREAGASGGYWIASSTDYIIANRMSITGSIGVISSYLEFSGLMNEYGVGYERLVSGELKDLGTPFKKLKQNEQQILQKKIDVIHNYFVEEVSVNRNLPKEKVEKIATGEFYLGVEALNLGLIDQLGDMETAKDYYAYLYEVDEVDLVSFKTDPSLFDILAGISQDFSYNMGQGIGSMFTQSSSSSELLLK
ncbi:signal peptide peptidase SppA [Candidatus Woesearchaeota archaeon]|jgi:protease IV|nr:signal peptide peptidase SppA [Candidatus Woesearchaeota archaeon]MBT4150631.1 signal peptide peptidase SppA [Candidatus Woesearchaeota archaeon]MBT4247849.1 signal peptide peptidase SppA [Candidatus Woesearchaeota archaeon]MBT4434273.1 signal peptide peptidase SppA [Candidatus Woesearchaeota archaeon]MBT7331806.1 signal peptide peptidase SppA [Candidatus Woesearchaeota archaeon]